APLVAHALGAAATSAPPPGSRLSVPSMDEISVQASMNKSSAIVVSQLQKLSMESITSAFCEKPERPAGEQRPRDKASKGQEEPAAFDPAELLKRL
ncbi:unnamed protein product, partial [Prorocentrum cordatum]